MIVERPDPSQVVLQTIVGNENGTPKTALSSAHVRVYHLDTGSEVDDLASTVLAQVGVTSIWRYIWAPGTLAVGHYFAEYSLVDHDGAEFVDVEDVVVQDFALQVDLALVKQVEQGRWKIDDTTDQMTFYAENGTTALLTFDLKDINGLPSSVNIFERKPV